MAVASFEYIFSDERLRRYDRSKNQERLSMWQLEADGLRWRSLRDHVRMFDEKGLAALFPDRSGFAIVECSLGASKNRLYFIDSDNSVLPHDLLSELSGYVPFDAFVTDGIVKVLYLSLTAQAYDKQVDYDPKTLKVVRWGPFK